MAAHPDRASPGYAHRSHHSLHVRRRGRAVRMSRPPAEAEFLMAIAGPAFSVAAVACSGPDGRAAADPAAHAPGALVIAVQRVIQAQSLPGGHLQHDPGLPDGWRPSAALADLDGQRQAWDWRRSIAAWLESGLWGDPDAVGRLSTRCSAADVFSGLWRRIRAGRSCCCKMARTRPLGRATETEHRRPPIGNPCERFAVRPKAGAIVTFTKRFPALDLPGKQFLGLGRRVSKLQFPLPPSAQPAVCPRPEPGAHLHPP